MHQSSPQGVCRVSVAAKLAAAPTRPLLYRSRSRQEFCGSAGSHVRAGHSVTTTAIIMAGGRSERMRAAGEHTHKALLRVAGQTMLERNIRSVFWHGLRDVVVVSSQQEP